jgi:hypothetical protein
VTDALLIALAAALGLGGWRAHVWLFPWKTCPRCGGSGRRRSGGAHADCGRCGAQGRVRRPGAPKGR